MTGIKLFNLLSTRVAYVSGYGYKYQVHGLVTIRRKKGRKVDHHPVHQKKCRSIKTFNALMV